MCRCVGVVLVILVFGVFFFKQKTAYEMRISDWSSDVCSSDLSGAEIDLIQMDDREQQLKQAISQVTDDYDFILIDCPPTLSLLTLNGLASAHGDRKSVV